MVFGEDAIEWGRVDSCIGFVIRDGPGSRWRKVKTYYTYDSYA